jgi:hypothetical protein
MGQWTPWQFKLSWVQGMQDPVAQADVDAAAATNLSSAGTAGGTTASRPFSISLCTKNGQARLPPEDIDPGNPGLWLTDVFII